MTDLMERHTQAPWTVDLAGWPLIVNGADGANVSIVAEVHDDPNNPLGITTHEPERLANVRLIAAAPQMLAVLVSVLQILGEADHDHILWIEQTIDKATGRNDG